MVSVKRKAAPSVGTPAKKRVEAFKDPYIDDEGSEDDDSISEDEASAEGGDFVEESDDESEKEAENVEGGEDDDAMSVTGHPKSTVSSKSLYKPPTNDEIQQLKETSDLFKSNLFKLQTDELLSEVRTNPTKTTTLEKALRSVKTILDSLLDIPDLSVSEATSGLLNEGIRVPYPDPAPPSDAQYKLAFKKPTKVFVVGSYLVRTAAKQPNGVNVDMAVQMPDELFQQKDHVNYRYFYKRAYYLALLAAEINKRRSELGLTLEFEAFQGDRRRPVLVLRSTGKVSEYDFSRTGFYIRIFPTVSQSVFPVSKLAPARNNVRPAVIHASTHDQTPTPRYNAALLQDTGLVAHMNLLHHHATTCAGFRDACMLSKVWLYQRGFNGLSGGFNGFLFAMIIGYLLRVNDKFGNRLLQNSFSSFQLFKVTMQFLATHDFGRDPIFMTADGKPIADTEFGVDSFKSQYDVVIVDPSGRINLAARMTAADLDELQYEARRSLQMLSDNETDHFEALFLKKVDLPRIKYDNIARIDAIERNPSVYTPAIALDFPSIHDFLAGFIPRLLKKALAKRIRLACVRSERLPSWNCDQEPHTHEKLKTSMHLGLILDPEVSITVVEHGPAAEDTEACEAFRQLWGDKSELRRFKDGSILESVVFDCDGTLEQRALIVGRMVGYLLHHHLGLVPKEDLHYWAGQLNKFLRAPGIEMQVPSFQGVMEDFNQFAKDIRRLDGVPLTINQVVPASDGLRYTSVFIPQPRMDDAEASVEAYRPYYPPLDVVLELEGSGKWPDDITAIELTKRALYLKIAEMFMQQHPGSRAVVSTGRGRHRLDNGALEVTTAMGYTFRCVIHVDREGALLERAIQNPTTPSSEVEALTIAKAAYDHTFVRVPFVSTRIQNLCLRYPFLPQTIRLVKRWLAAHLLSTQITDEAIELICCKVFVDSEAFEAPASGWVGFLRVLDLFKNWDWKRECMIVELEKGSLTVEKRNRIADTFRKERGLGTDGPLKLKPVMWLATEPDTESRWWTWDKPTAVIVERIRHLAVATLQHVEDVVYGNITETSLSKVFVAPPKGYDMLIRLHPARLTRFRESLSYDPESAELKAKYKNLLQVKDAELALLSHIDPAELYLEELQSAFGDVALFFHDRYGGDVIGVVWNPKATVTQSWKVNLHYNAEAVMSESEQKNGASKKKKQAWTVRPNFAAMAAEMERLGTGLVHSIDVITHKA
ncbi:Nrap protein [Gaertneriomyces semiglobifer]|nr:Nrap protein [Gaertneriomyces semiglobifer]